MIIERRTESQRLIDQLSPEQLEQIKRELGVETSYCSKQHITSEEMHKLWLYLRDIDGGPGQRNNYRPMSTKNNKVKPLIYEFADIATENFERNNTPNRFGNYQWTRTVNVPPKKQTIYKDFVNNLVDLFIETHKQIREVDQNER